MTYSTVGIVTGANKGIGYAIVRQLALQYSRGATSSGSFLIYLAARDGLRGESAVKSLYQDEALVSARVLARDGGLTDIKFHQLDVVDKDSIARFADHVKREHGEGIDFLVNNAGIALDGFNEDIVRTTINCNYHGMLDVIRAFTPLMKPNGRIVNMGSEAGGLHKYSPALAERFRAAKTVAEVTTLMDEFIDAVRRGAEKEEGWPSAGYAVSKTGVIALTRVLAAELQAMQEEPGQHRCAKGVEVVSCCPGWVVTDMTKGRGHKLPDEGATTPVMLALKGSGGKPGSFWVDERIKPF